MERKAIMFAASLEDDHATDVYSDLIAFRTFLTSNQGGSWEPDELICEKNPTREIVLQCVIEAKDVEYTLVYFKGRCEKIKNALPWPEMNMQLKSGQTLSENEINSGSPKCLIIVDCTRTLNQEHKQTLFDITSISENNGKNRAAYRKLYEQSLQAAESGLVKIIANKVYGSINNTRSFTQQLLDSANSWTCTNKGLLYLNDAVELARNQMTSDSPQNSLEYQGGRRIHPFPFAVQL